jgi:hypothetical protein
MAPKPPAQAQIVHDVHPADADGPTIQADVDDAPRVRPRRGRPDHDGRRAARSRARACSRSSEAGRRCAAFPPPAHRLRRSPCSTRTRSKTKRTPPSCRWAAARPQPRQPRGQRSQAPLCPRPACPAPAPSAPNVSKATSVGGFAPPGAPPDGPATKPPPPLPGGAGAPGIPPSTALFGGSTMALGASANPAFMATALQPQAPMPAPQAPISASTNPFDFQPAGGPQGAMGAGQNPMGQNMGQNPMGPKPHGPKPHGPKPPWAKTPWVKIPWAKTPWARTWVKIPWAKTPWAARTWGARRP